MVRVSSMVSRALAFTVVELSVGDTPSSRPQLLALSGACQNGECCRMDALPCGRKGARMKRLVAQIENGQSFLEKALVSSATCLEESRQSAVQYKLSRALKSVAEALELAQMKEGQGC